MSEVVRDLSSGLDRLRASLSGLDDTGLMQLLRDFESVSRQVMSAKLDAVAEIDSRGIAAREGFGTTRRLIGAVLHLSAADARAQEEQARLLGARRSVVGELLEPQLPATAAAMAEGRIGPRQVRVITETMTLLPTSVPEPARTKVEADLAGYAADFDPRRLRTLASRILAHVDPDGPAPAAEPTATLPPRGELWLRDRRDSGVGLEGWFHAEHGAMLRSLIDQLAVPRPAVDDIPNERSVPARKADALIELANPGPGRRGLPHQRRRTPAPHRTGRLRGPARRGRHRHPGLRPAHHRRRSPTPRLRRADHPRRARRRLRTARCRPRIPDCAPRAAQGADRPGSRLHLPRLRPPARPLRRPPPTALGRQRRHLHHQTDTLSVVLSVA